MATPALSAQEHAASFSSKKRTIALVIVALAFVIDLVDSTIVNIAIPTIRDNLGASYAAVQWVVAGYALAFATLLVTGGRMGDVYGYKKIFMLGVAGFTLASLLSGLSTSPTMLIIARLFQGAMAALMVPQVMSLMQVMYKPEERGSVNGLFGALGGLSASLGPVIGGLLIKANVAGLDWRPIFLINIPIGMFALFMGFKYLPDGKSPHPLKLDIFGTLLIVGTIFLLAFPLIQGRDYGWPAWTFIMMAAALPVLVLFMWWQKRKERLDGSPLVLPALFKSRSFGVGLAVNLVFEMAMIGFFLTFTLLLQIGLGFSVIHAALTGLPVAFGIAFTMALAGEKLIPKLGRYALALGTVIMALGLSVTLLVLHKYLSSIHSWQLIPGLLLTGIGMGFVFSSLFAAVLNGVDARHAGSASGVLNAIQQVGGAVGVAVIGVIFFGLLNSHAATSFTAVEPALTAKLTDLRVPQTQQVNTIAFTKACYIDRSRQKDAKVTPKSCQITPSTAAQRSTTEAVVPVNVGILADASLQANANNFNYAFRWAMLYAIGLLGLTFGLSFVLPKHFRTEAYTQAL